MLINSGGAYSIKQVCRPWGAGTSLRLSRDFPALYILYMFKITVLTENHAIISELILGPFFSSFVCPHWYLFWIFCFRIKGLFIYYVKQFGVSAAPLPPCNIVKNSNCKNCPKMQRNAEICGNSENESVFRFLIWPPAIPFLVHFGTPKMREKN